MKKVILSVLLLSIIMGLQAQELKVINLNKPDKSRNVTLMQEDIRNEHLPINN